MNSPHLFVEARGGTWEESLLCGKLVVWANTWVTLLGGKRCGRGCMGSRPHPLPDAALRRQSILELLLIVYARVTFPPSLLHTGAASLPSEGRCRLRINSVAENMVKVGGEAATTSLLTQWPHTHSFPPPRPALAPGQGCFFLSLL